MAVCCICDVEIGSPPECISFHRFPKQDNRKLRWLTVINENIKNFAFTANSQICSQHFTVDCFVVTCSGRRYLKSNAVPSIFSMPLKQGLEMTQPVNTVLVFIYILIHE
ncbi:THAP domain-containing protein [Ooceraea biroi]|uniref:THAP domain-containing protein n=1 Tax=Ooceraea biroi TaxID=2015173 RepID=A0A026VTH4_OOCBI|nr:THAP domain-containing protein [Ooceraea biroi]